jgi:hypothetical protein
MAYLNIFRYGTAAQSGGLLNQRLNFGTFNESHNMVGIPPRAPPNIANWVNSAG